MTARIILLNGTSSAGKTTLVAALRPLLPHTFCYYASDQLANAGLWPIDPVARLNGRTPFFDGFHRSIAAFASAALDLLVEHIVEHASWRADLAILLRPFDVFRVRLFVPIEELERRERARGDRTIGEAREHLSTHDHCSYDISVDTTQPPSITAAAIARTWHARAMHPAPPA